MIQDEILIFGAGTFAQKLAKAYEQNGTRVISFVISKKNCLDNIDGIPVSTFEEIKPSSGIKTHIAVGVFNRVHSYQSLANIFSDNGFINIVWPWEYFPQLADFMGWCYFLDPNPKCLSEWKAEQAYSSLLDMLSDEESQETLNSILAFRCGEDINFSGFNSSDQQYFNRLTLPNAPLANPLCYVDLGAYNGDTLQELCGKALVGTALLLEPDPKNFQDLTSKSKFLAKNHITLNPYNLPFAAGDDYGMFFLAGEGEAASITSSQNPNELRPITVVPLDEIMPSLIVDFVKIDVEGHDLSALRGMKFLLQRSNPVIAVSLYHRPNDILSIPLELSQILDGKPYNYYIRQHMNNSFDSVLYCVPKER